MLYKSNFVVYLIKYIPWENNIEGNPWKYIGSTSKQLENYFGSVSSRKWMKWWIDETKSNPLNFEKLVLCNSLSTDRKILLKLEEQFQREYDVVNSMEYFNLSYATTGCFGLSMVGKNNSNYGKRMTPEQKKSHSTLLKEVWNNPKLLSKVSEIQKIAQRTPEVVEAKRTKQKIAWKNGLMSNCVKSQYQATQIKFKDFWFKSKKNFKLFLKENNVAQYKNIKTSEYIDWNIQEYFLFDKIKQSSFFSCVSKFGVTFLINVCDYLILNKFSVKHNPGIGLNMSRLKDHFNIDENFSCTFINFISKNRNKYSETRDKLYDILKTIQTAEHSLLKGYI